jgi:hypothetical protein
MILRIFYERMCPFLKKALMTVLCFALLTGLLAFGVAAQEEEPSYSLLDTVIQEAHDSYYNSRATAGKTSFHGTCGLMVSHQLYNLGINRKRIVFDGNDHYDYYADLEKTTGGYYIYPYPAEGYTLKEALLAVSHDGMRDVMNVLVGFQWTNTEAGSKYGHVVLINGIVDGTVYFVESFDCSLGGAEGTVLTCSIEEFAKYYDRWTTFEGLIHFGVGSYHDVCPRVTTDLTVQARYPTVLRSEPAVVGQQGCTRLRSVAAGERLRATGIYWAEYACYYRIETNEGFGFLPAGAVAPVKVNTESVFLSGLIMPDRIRAGTQPAFAGTATDQYGSISTVEVCITDSKGELVRRELAEPVDDLARLQELRDGLYFDLLEPDTYLVEIYATRSCPVVISGSLVDRYARVLLASRELQVGGDPRNGQIIKELKPSREGWFREDGLWYCYRDGAPCAGWITQLGVRYFLRADGTAVTGWQNVEQKQLYFSAAGALVTGWLTVDGKTYYRAADGTAVTGWQQVDGQLYCFDEEGIMLTDTEQDKDGTLYQIAKDGTAKEK